MRASGGTAVKAAPGTNRANPNRRAVLGRIAGGLAAAGAAPAWADATEAGRLALDIFRRGAKIGEHRFEFAPTAEGRRVSSLVDIRVRIAFVTVFRYHQAAEDDWRGPLLVGTRVRTDDDGKVTSVVAAVEGDRLRVQGPTGVHEAELGTMTDINFWNAAIVHQKRLIDSQLGDLMTVVCEARGTELVRVRGLPLRAHRYAMRSPRDRSGSVWYDDGGRLVQAELLTRGERLEYRLSPES